jgi:hypothetical protein
MWMHGETTHRILRRRRRHRLIRSAIACEMMADFEVVVVFVELWPHVAVAIWPLVVCAVQKPARFRAVLLG